MKPSFHEDFSRPEEVKGSSDRGFGLTVGGILLLIAIVRSYFTASAGCSMGSAGSESC
jgi:hypothetical protein